MRESLVCCTTHHIGILLHPFYKEFNKIRSSFLHNFTDLGLLTCYYSRVVCKQAFSMDPIILYEVRNHVVTKIGAWWTTMWTERGTVQGYSSEMGTQYRKLL